MHPCETKRVIRRCYQRALLLFISGALTITISSLSAQSSSTSWLPKNAVVIERARIPAAVHPNRAVILWMINPTKHDRGPLLDNSYTCPEMTLGSYYSGPTRLTLLDTQTGNVINTISLKSRDSSADEFYIPYRIISGSYYPVPGVRKDHEGKPELLKWRDLNGDGIAAETDFFEAEACMGLPTALVGYSMAHDKVIQYSAKIEITEFDQKSTGEKRRKDKSRVETQLWIDYLFSEKQIQPRRWKYSIDYTGRAGCLDSYDIRYEPQQEAFIGSLTEVCPPPDR